MVNSNLSTLLVECAHQEGFPLAGVVDIDLAFSDPHLLLQSHIDYFDQWLQEGFAGSMNYLSRGRDRRANPKLLMPDAQSILCVALPYPKIQAGASDSKQGVQYARYLHGRDYHQIIPEKLEGIMNTVKSKWISLDSTELRWKICVDTSAVLERTWAALAGLGWIGKNTLLIHPTFGSYLFLAEVLINQKTYKGSRLLPHLCGNCRRCLESCPTQAFSKPQVLNSNRCISYWTLEKRGDLNLTDSDQKKMGNRIAGCDRCQEVCPFNFKPTRRELQETLPHPESFSSATILHQWTELLIETVSEYKTRVKSSALNRIKPSQFSRNLALLFFNYLTQNQLQRNQEKETFKTLVIKRLNEEEDLIAKKEWLRCHDFLNSK